MPYMNVEPMTRDWQDASLTARAEFRQFVVKYTLEEKDAELARGLDRHGRKRWVKSRLDAGADAVQAGSVPVVSQRSGPAAPTSD
jgi:hypothetical protein